VDQSFDDLLPLFLSEAGERLDRLEKLLAEPSSAEDLARARRELHALKGAGRMLGMADFAALCHRAETLLERPTATSLEEVRELHRQLAATVAGGSTAPVVASAAVWSADGAPATSLDAVEAALKASADVRVPTEVIDALSDRSARLRVLTVGSASLVNRVFRLAHLAERGVSEPAPRQVLATLATSLRQLGVEFDAGQRRIQRLSEGQLETLLREQVRPLRPVLESLARHARELSESLGKSLRVELSGGDTQLDRRIIVGLQEVLVHVVRNAVDHGIEHPAERTAAGKSPQGVVRLEAGSDGDLVRLEVTDDGRGVDRDEVVEIAVVRGILSPEEADSVDHREALRLLCRAGFSTRTEATDVSGRGIGLDAVASAVHGLGGDLWIDSEPGAGTAVTVEVPVSRRGERVVVLRVGQSVVAVPAAPVRSYRRIDPEGRYADRGGDTQLAIGNDHSPVRDLADLDGDFRRGPGVVVVGMVLGAPLALVADELLGSEEVFLKPAPVGVGMPTLCDGLAVLAGGRPVPVLSWQRLIELDEDAWRSSRGSIRARTIRVLLVDDSRITREMIRRLLEDAGFAVTTCGAADEARRLLANEDFDCLITDIEMPETDGLELTRWLRADARLEDLPIIVVSTRDRPSDHRAGLDAGADAYLSKHAFEARELIKLVRRSSGGGR
jgi:chemotaxis protein histidine kinase CheA